MPLAGYTTEVPALRTVLEIQDILARAGAQSVLIDYGPDREPAAVSFRVEYKGTLLSFRLPCDWQNACKVLQRDPKVERRYKSPEHARRVAWRVVRDWLRAQIAMVEIGNADLPQVMLSYVQSPDGTTLYDRLVESDFRQLRLEAANQ